MDIAYQVVGEGPFDLVFVPGFISHLDLQWVSPLAHEFFERLASFSRLILFDKRGTGLSDPVAGPAPLEERMDDLRAVMDAAGSERAAIVGVSEGGPLAILFAATYPERVSSLALCGTFACGNLDPEDNPAGARWLQAMVAARELIPEWGTGKMFALLAPSAEGRVASLGLAAFERSAASPRMVKGIYDMVARNRRSRHPPDDRGADARGPPRARVHPRRAGPVPGVAHTGGEAHGPAGRRPRPLLRRRRAVPG